MNNDDLRILISGDIDLSKTQAQIQKKLNTAKTTVKINVDSNLNTATSGLKNFNAQLEKSIATNRLTTYLKDNAIAAKKSKPAFDQLSNSIKSFSDRSDITRWNKEFRSATLEVKALGNTGNGVFASMTKEVKKFVSWTMASGGVMAAITTFRQMIDNVKELDLQMTELRKVTDETDSTYNQFLERASQNALNLGSTLTDLVRATGDFARLGYGIEDAENLAQVSTLYKQVGDGISSIDEANSVVISTMKAFNIEAKDSIHIVDALNEVGNNFASSSKDIGEGLLRSASALSSANNTFEESVGLFISMNEIIQDAEKSGTALRTIALRLRNTAGSLEELDEDATGAAESITKLQTQILNLTSGKVDIMLDADTFKSTYQIINELSGVWDNLSDKSQADLTRLIAGIRQGNTFNALMSNMANGINATATALDSSGSALKENEKVLASISGKINQFNAAFESLSNNFIGSDLVKSVVDIGTSAVKILDGVINRIEALPTLITGIVTAMNLAGKNVGKQICPPYESYSVNRARCNCRDVHVDLNMVA